MLTKCHICFEIGETEIVKCKLCCDGWEQDFCATCKKLYNEMCDKVMQPESDALLKDLQERRKAGVLKIARKLM